MKKTNLKLYNTGWSPFDSLIGESPSMKGVRKYGKEIADNDYPVLLTGETGTGKTVLAEAIHMGSPRGNKRFFKVNAAAVPGSLAESELFGYKKGSFTGALTDKKGLFERADYSTLLIDDIGEMSPEVQAKLLHVLDGGYIQMIGSNKDIHVDVRLITATNRDISSHESGFREDLFHRISTMNIHIPSLRDRAEDIPLILQHFSNGDAGKGGPVYSFDSTAMNKLYDHEWPGNVRELRNLFTAIRIRKKVREGDSPTSVVMAYDVEDGFMAMEKGINHVDDQGYDPKFVQDLLGHGHKLNDMSLTDYRTFMENVKTPIQREYFTRILEKTGWNRKKAADIAKVSYKTLLTKISELGIKKGI